MRKVYNTFIHQPDEAGLATGGHVYRYINDLKKQSTYLITASCIGYWWGKRKTHPLHPAATQGPIMVTPL